MDRENIKSEYIKMLDKLQEAENWAIKKGIEWDLIPKYEYENKNLKNKYIEFAWKRDNIIKEIEATRELLGLPV